MNQMKLLIEIGVLTVLTLLLCCFGAFYIAFTILFFIAIRVFKFKKNQNQNRK